jgi:hypothetical protein
MNFFVGMTDDGNSNVAPLQARLLSSTTLTEIGDLQGSIFKVFFFLSPDAL